MLFRSAANGTLRIELAFDPDTGDLCVGYCVTSLSRDKEGEIESIFVEDARKGVDSLDRALTKAAGDVKAGAGKATETIGTAAKKTADGVKDVARKVSGKDDL